MHKEVGLGVKTIERYLIIGPILPADLYSAQTYIIILLLNIVLLNIV